MNKLYCVICSKYRKFVKPKISYLSEKTLVLSIICSGKIRTNWDIKNSRFWKLKIGRRKHKSRI